MLLIPWLAALLASPVSAQYSPRTSFTRDELISHSFNWLSKSNDRDLIHVYKLSCPSCIVEMKAAFRHDPHSLGPIYFSTFKKEDRPLAQALIATTLSQPEEKRAEVFGELLSTFVNSAQQFQKNPAEWRTLCLSYWNTEAAAIEDPTIWADALNWMDRQNRLNILMDATTFPGSIEVRDNNPIAPIRKKTYRDGFVFVALSLPWLKYPEHHPVPDITPSENHPEQLPVVIIDVLKLIPIQDWKKHANTARTGAFWHFIGDPELVLHDRLLEFLAAYLDMPTDTERREAFADAIESIAGNRSGPGKSILATLPRLKDLPEVSREHKEQRMAEARSMIEDFLAYDAYRK